MRRPDILVVGSINVDLLLFQPRLAAKGETLLADSVREEFGGKGANQAVQAARLGHPTTFIGAVGRDERGRASQDNLVANGIECHLANVDLPTGLGIVNVLPDGEVHATIVRGANEAVTPDLVRNNAGLFRHAGIVVLQNEIPDDSNAEAIRCARASGATLIYNAAPARKVDVARTRACDYLILNEDEAAFFLGYRPDTVDAMATAIPELHGWCERVVVTLGSAGSLLSTPDGLARIAATPVHAIDTTGAGDAYVGAFAAALNDGEQDVTAARVAANVAAMATRAIGAQTSMPRMQEVQDDPVRAQARDPGRTT